MDKQAREAAFLRVASTQPGCTPYDNTRPIRIGKRFAGMTLQAVLAKLHCYENTPQRLLTDLDAGLIRVDGKDNIKLDTHLVAGNIVTVRNRETSEPAVATKVSVIFEDEYLLVVNKPAPLPVHPSGRFHKNSLIYLASMAWPDIDLKPVHRLDAATTGVLLLAKSAAVANAMMQKFQAHEIKKTYTVRVHGVPKQQRFTVHEKIEKHCSPGGTRKIDDAGQEAATDFELLRVLDDGTSVLHAYPKTGRTNQIRLHLQSIGYPIVGDNAYGVQDDMRSGMTRGLKYESLCLHARCLELMHPMRAGRVLRFDAPERFGFC